MKIKVYKNKGLTLKICLAAMCLALAFVLPFITGTIPEIGGMLCPMHLPAFLLGIVIGPYFGAGFAFLTPILRSLIFGTPLLFPRAFTMAFELMAYAFVFGLLYKLLPKKLPFIYASLLSAMVAGRVVGGIVKTILFEIGAMGKWSYALFVSGYITETIPGVIIQLLVIPPLVMALRNDKIIK